MYARLVIALLLCCGLMACSKPAVEPSATTEDSTATSPDSVATPIVKPIIYKLDSTKREFSGIKYDIKGGPYGYNDTTQVDSFYLYFRMVYYNVINQHKLIVEGYTNGQLNQDTAMFQADTAAQHNYPNAVKYTHIIDEHFDELYFDTTANKIVSYIRRSSYGGNYGNGVAWGYYLNEK